MPAGGSEVNCKGGSEIPDRGGNLILVRVKVGHRLAFVAGLVVGAMLLRHQVMADTYHALTTWWQGYETDPEGRCVVESHGKREPTCRPLVDCVSLCHGLDPQSADIDRVPASEMTQDLFLEKYATGGRPVVVVNATKDWPAMDTFDFYFFRDLFEELDSPVLRNDDPDCAFFAWDKFGDEFVNVQSVFDMSDRRISQGGGGGGSRPWYVGWANCDDAAVDILRDYYWVPDFIPADAEAGRRDWIFMGTAGYGAPFHIDNVKYPSWQAQVRIWNELQITGLKSWTLRPPPECRKQCPSELKSVLAPGDVIVVNTNWWFHSTSVLQDVSVTITNEFIL